MIQSSSAVVYSASKKNYIECVMSEEQLVENATIQLFDPCQYSTTLPKEAKDRYISKLADLGEFYGNRYV
ncbi:hypothetical protein OUZ56_033277 [Daphnia magna]|uniref:Uncharacterized protein n=1 Tax=Daphnia magna TaxID=35525 RepID=A0ABR0BAI0_9CRUS|nr:hypothetical protein OUZ56_033277 [Daphnia magna]